MSYLARKVQDLTWEESVRVPQTLPRICMFTIAYPRLIYFPVIHENAMQKVDGWHMHVVVCISAVAVEPLCRCCPLTSCGSTFPGAPRIPHATSVWPHSPGPENRNRGVQRFDHMGHLTDKRLSKFYLYVTLGSSACCCVIIYLGWMQEIWSLVINSCYIHTWPLYEWTFVFGFELLWWGNCAPQKHLTRIKKTE
jgi:hypothetical protein